MKKSIIVIFTVLLSTAVWADGQSESSKVIATTSWTAAFAELAGVDAVVLAPYEMQHPSEYELKPTDIAMVSEAEMIIFAGYENMVGKIKENAGSEETKMIQITTVMNYPTMNESVTKIAEAAGTAEDARKNLNKMKALLDESREDLKKEELYGKRAVVHMFQQAFAREMGFDVIAVYGPQPLQANQIGDIAKMDADLIIDNWHNPVSQPLREVLSDAKAVELINFPGKDGTEDLFDVVKYNMDQLK